MPQYLKLAENPYQLSQGEFDLSEAVDFTNYIFFPDKNGGGEWHHVRRFADMTPEAFEYTINQLAPFQPAMNENQYALSEDGSIYELPAMSASDWKQQKREQKIANQAAKTGKKVAAANLKNAKAAGIEGGTYESPLAKIGGSAAKGLTGLAGKLLGGVTGDLGIQIGGAVPGNANPPADGMEHKPSIFSSMLETWQSIPTIGKLGIGAGVFFVGYKLATKKKKKK